MPQSLMMPMPTELFDTEIRIFAPVRDAGPQRGNDMTWPGAGVPVNAICSQMTMDDRETYQVDQSVIGWLIEVDYQALLTAGFSPVPPLTNWPQQNWRITFNNNTLRVRTRATDADNQHVLWLMPCEQIT